MKFGELLRKARKEKHLSQSELAKMVNSAQKTISRLENSDGRSLTIEKLELFCEILDLDINYVVSLILDNPTTPSSVEYIDIFGSVPAGMPVEAIQNIIGSVPIVRDLYKTNNKIIALRVNGFSMDPIYQDGDVVLIELTNDVIDGDDVVAYVNGYDATLKRLKIDTDGTIILHALNEDYNDINFKDSAESLRILGKVIEMRRDK